MPELLRSSNVGTNSMMTLNHQDQLENYSGNDHLSGSRESLSKKGATSRDACFSPVARLNSQSSSLSSTGDEVRQILENSGLGHSIGHNMNSPQDSYQRRTYQRNVDEEFPKHYTKSAGKRANQNSSKSSSQRLTSSVSLYSRDKLKRQTSFSQSFDATTSASPPLRFSATVSNPERKYGTTAPTFSPPENQYLCSNSCVVSIFIRLSESLDLLHQRIESILLQRENGNINSWVSFQFLSFRFWISKFFKKFFKIW